MKSKQPQSEDKIQCQLCDNWFYQINWAHLLAKHNITTHEYKEEFEIDSFWSESLRNSVTKWTKERIIQEIKKRYRNGEPLNYRHMNRRRYWLCVEATKRYFGDWKEAIEAAGLDYEEVSLQKRWTRQNIIEAITNLKTESHPLYSTYIQRHFRNLYLASLLHFGGWRQAVEAAGFEYEIKPRPRRWSREKLIAELKEFKARGEKTNRKYFHNNYPALEGAIIRTFKNCDNALTEAGIR